MCGGEAYLEMELTRSRSSRQAAACIAAPVLAPTDRAPATTRRAAPGRRRLSFVSIVFLAAGLAAVALADPDTQALSPTLAFDIPEQPLVTALQAYSAVSGVAVLYESGLEGSQHSVAVAGEFTREAALRALLGNTDLLLRYSRADAVTLSDPSIAAPDEPPGVLPAAADLALDTLHVAGASNRAPDRTALANYVIAIQRDIQDALRNSPAARGGGGYRVGVDLWVDASRAVERTQVFRSTGDPDRDIAIVSALQGLTFRQSPPDDTPQPVRVMIVVTAM